MASNERTDRMEPTGTTTVTVHDPSGQLLQIAQPSPSSTFGEVMASVVMWFIAIIVLGTLAGLWVKWFWLGYVFR